jgi:hypothetical protein
MAATVTLNEHNSATPDTRTDKTAGTIRCRTSDSATVDSNNPLPKPGSGLFTRSYEKWLQLRIGATGPGGVITNTQFYTSGGPGTGATVYLRTANPASYSTPATPANDSAGTDASTYVTGSRKSMGAGPYSSINTNIGSFAVLWMTLADTVTAPQSPTADLNLFFSYDET